MSRERDTETGKAVPVPAELSEVSLPVTEPELTLLTQKVGKLNFSRICWSSETT